jgi:hypothetical protein
MPTQSVSNGIQSHGSLPRPPSSVQKKTGGSISARTDLIVLSRHSNEVKDFIKVLSITFDVPVFAVDFDHVAELQLDALKRLVA